KEQLIREKLRVPNDQRIFYIRYALEEGMSVQEIADLTNIDPWFINTMREVLAVEEKLRSQASSPGGWKTIPPDILKQAKEAGFSDRQLAYLFGAGELEVRQFRKDKGITASFKPVDTCAGEFGAERPYYYSTYGERDESRISGNKKVLILGGGPNRIGQGIEFDYCCVHASYALREEGYESIMVNSNPETVSTDYDTSDKLYFEPLTREDVLNIIDKEKPEGVIIQFGGQTPLSLAVPLEEAGVRILGTSPDSIDRAEDRERFNNLLKKLGLVKPDNGTGTSVEEAKKIAAQIGYPVLVRPSYVLGGRAMQIVYDEAELESYMQSAVEASPEHPVLVEKFLEDAIEVDVDALADGETVVIGGIMEHIEEAGIHSGDSACVLPPISLAEDIIDKIRQYTYALAKELNVIGLMNVQYAVRNDIVYVLEVNPRASRTVPFVSKATGLPLAKIATKLMLGKKLTELGITKEPEISHVAVKEAVFPFHRFPGVDAILGPEMKSTGEVMGIDQTFGLAFAKSQLAAGLRLPLKGTVFISVKNQDKRAVVFIAKKLADLGFSIVATKGTARVLRQNDIEVQEVLKLHEGRPHVLDLLKNKQIDLMINTTSGHQTKKDERLIRSYAVTHSIPLITTISGASATVNGLESLIKKKLTVKSLQEYHANFSY
ncbi:MAG: carbamoyl-phosphate synthase large subunit, partial [Clostridia bacterium]|nr:carbamoyl-phosphate synthase large subunit [Clostridia bacterium]